MNGHIKSKPPPLTHQRTRVLLCTELFYQQTARLAADVNLLTLGWKRKNQKSFFMKKRLSILSP